MGAEAGMTIARTPADVAHAGQVRALAEILRSILVAALAAAVVGIVVGGLGGRIVMRLAALLNPTSVGFSTENGNVVGEITLSGTFALLLFGGLFVGLAASVVWVTVAPWLPRERRAQALAAAVLAVALGGVAVVDSRNPDFALLDHDLIIVTMLLAVPALFGLTLPVVIRWVDRRLPHPGADPVAFTLLTGGLVLLGGFLFVPITAAAFFNERACLCSVAPVQLGVPLVVAGVATVASWVVALRGRASPPAIALTGRAAVAVAAVLGLAILVQEIDRIPG